MNGDAWLARIDWVEIRVFWDGGQWRSTAKALSMHHCLGTGTLAQAQREALRLLENALWGPVKALIAAREAVVGKLVLPESATKNEPRGRK